MLKFTIRFYLDARKDIRGDQPIYLHLAWKGNRLALFTGQHIESKKWKSDKKEKIYQVKQGALNSEGIPAKTINETLTALRAKVEGVINEALVTGKPLTAQYIKERLNPSEIEGNKPGRADFWTSFETYIKELDTSERTRQQYTACMNRLKEWRPKLSWSDVDMKSFILHLQKTKGRNTVFNIVKKIRSFYCWAIRRKLTNVNPFVDLEIPGEKYGMPIFLTRQERDKLTVYDLSFNDNLARIRDLFIFQCHTGCRVGDLMKLTRDNVQGGILEYMTGKTKTVCRVPLSPVALSIWNKGLLKISDAKYNKYLKDVFTLAKLNRLVIRLNPRTGKSEQVKLCDIVTSHMARRTFVGILHKTVKNEIIASMSGHTGDSRAFSRYYAVDDDQRREAIEEL